MTPPDDHKGIPPERVEALAWLLCQEDGEHTRADFDVNAGGERDYQLHRAKACLNAILPDYAEREAEVERLRDTLTRLLAALDSIDWDRCSRETHIARRALAALDTPPTEPLDGDKP